MFAPACRGTSRRATPNGWKDYIDSFTTRCPLPKRFIIPGRTADSAALHVARTICRRAERHIVGVNRELGGYDEILVYTNRLSDLLFVLGWSMEVMAVVDDTVREVLALRNEMRHAMRLPYVISEILAAVAEAEAVKIGVPMAIAIVDEEGGLQFFKRIDGTLPVSTELASPRRTPRRQFACPRTRWVSWPSRERRSTGFSTRITAKSCFSEAAIRFASRDKVVGGIGVSGGTVEQDMLVAEPAVHMLEYIECWAKELRPLVPHVNGNGSWTTLPAVKEKLFAAFAGQTPQIPESTIAALTGGVLLALA